MGAESLEEGDRPLRVGGALHVNPEDRPLRFTRLQDLHAVVEADILVLVIAELRRLNGDLATDPSALDQVEHL